MTASAGPVLKDLHQRFGHRVAFLTLYVREAHPGERYPQATSFDEKLAHARAYQQRDEIPWSIAVDDIDGTLHQRLDPKPNAAYIVDADGRVFSRVLWSNYAEPLATALEAVTGGTMMPHAEREPRLVPMLRGLGRMDEILSLAGDDARRDVMREAPPMYGIARLAGLFRPLPPLGRSLTAISVVMGTALLVAGGLRGRRRS